MQNLQTQKKQRFAQNQGDESSVATFSPRVVGFTTYAPVTRRDEPESSSLLPPRLKKSIFKLNRSSGVTLCCQP